MNKLFIALLAGVAVGLLIAPDKGSVTRKKLMDGFKDWADNLEGLKEKLTHDDPQIVPEPSFSTPKMSDAI